MTTEELTREQCLEGALREMRQHFGPKEAELLGIWPEAYVPMFIAIDALLSTLPEQGE